MAINGQAGQFDELVGSAGWTSSIDLIMIDLSDWHVSWLDQLAGIADDLLE